MSERSRQPGPPVSVTGLLGEIADVGTDRVRGGYSRPVYSGAETDLRDWFTEHAQRRGLAVEVDRNGIIWAWWNPAGEPLLHALVTGSHLDPARLGRDEEALRRIGLFVELHVEQGRGLIDLGQSVAVASSILSHGRWRLSVTGEGNHAGTTRRAAAADRRRRRLRRAGHAGADRLALRPEPDRVSHSPYEHLEDDDADAGADALAAVLHDLLRQ